MNSFVNASNRVEKKRKIQPAPKATKIQVVNEIYNNNVKSNMKPNPTFEPNMENNPIFEKLTNENKKPLISVINSLKQLPRNKKTIFKGRLNSAFKNQNLNKMKAIRNEAIAANKEIQNQLAKQKKLKEEAKEAQRKKEAEIAAKRKAEREAKKKTANNMKRQLNAANNILKLANKALTKKEATRKAAEGAAEAAKQKLRRNAEKKATLSNKSSYQAKINSRNFKIPKNRKKIFTSRIQKATTVGQVLKAYNNAQKELQ
jgi:septal ring factor EnvC (AmiA/AmiB activator)